MANVFDDKERGKNDLLYGGSAQQAMTQAMLEAGYNPFGSNPFMKQLMRASNGLGAAATLNGFNSGMSADDVVNAGGESGMLRKFMTDALKGGTVYSQLNSARGGVKDALNRVTGIQNDIAAGKLSADDANPFAKMLAGMFDDPESAQGVMTALAGPLLGNRLGQSYGQQLGDIGQSQLARMAGEGNKTANFWEYMFNNMTPGQGAPDGGAAVAAQSTGTNALNPTGAPTAGEPGGPPLANGPVLQTGAPDGPVNGPAVTPEVAAGIQSAQKPTLGPELPPEQVSAIAAQAGISEDSLLKILRDLAVEGGTAAGLPMQAFSGLSTSNIMPNVKSLNPYLARLLNLAGA